VRVVVGDGEYGHAERAPYDRVIVTAGAWDVPDAWKGQLAPGGRLVVPLRMRGVTRSVALELHAGVWQSVSVEECGFMPVRGAGAVTERNVELLGDSGVRFRVDDGQPIDADALGAALAVPAALAWSGVVVPEKPFDHLDFWLAGTAAAAVCRIFLFDRALESGLARPIYPWGSMGLYTGSSFAYLIRRPAAGGGEPLCELGVCAYGPDGEQLAGRAADQVRAWGRARETLAGLRVEVHPAGSPDVPGAMMSVEKTSSRVFVSAIPA
jgi:protein-L-isoaspartate(D-aspartate) O-methyltransferase